MKKYLLQGSSVALVVIGVFLGSVMTGNRAIAQKIAALTGSGSPGQLAKWTSSSNLGDSGISADKTGMISISNGIKFADGSIQTSAPIGTSLSHHQELTLIGQPSESLSFELPRKDFPVQIFMSTSVIVEQFVGCNGTQTVTFTSGPHTASVTAAQDSSTGRVSIKGVSFGDEAAYWSASLRADQATGRIVILIGSCNFPNPNCCSTTPQFVISGPITYHVSMWY